MTRAEGVRHQRASGRAQLSFRRDERGRSVLGDLYQQAPCRVLFPQVEAGEPPQAVLLTTTGGLTGGDEVRFSIEVGAGASATVTTQAAEKLYRALPTDADTRIEFSVRAARDSWLECLAQETILFDQARLRRRFDVELEAGARLLAVESLVFGRTAMNERFRQGRVHDAWRVRRDGRLIWADAWHLDGDIEALRAAPFGFGTAVASATVLYVGDEVPRLLGEVRRVLDGDRHGGASGFEHFLLVRLLDDDAARLRTRLMHVAATLRAAAAGLPPRLPRVWTC
ncbi:urease accessory protein UreD [Solimonas variicoloris]|uniref:urease accessory protein UreD n=1 Tax=Solimonas variicoloris TaxID=254408 RepID=UPI00036500DF|nr:urease accessory protein UreD [Solimonas variicoloris]